MVQLLSSDKSAQNRQLSVQSVRVGASRQMEAIDWSLFISEMLATSLFNRLPLLIIANF